MSCDHVNTKGGADKFGTIVFTCLKCGTVVKKINQTTLPLEKPVQFSAVLEPGGVIVEDNFMKPKQVKMMR